MDLIAESIDFTTPAIEPVTCQVHKIKINNEKNYIEGKICQRQQMLQLSNQHVKSK